MSIPVENQQSDHSRVWTDNLFEDPGHGASLAELGSLVAGAGAAIGVRALIKEVGFPSNDQYEAQQGNIDAAKDDLHNINAARIILRDSGVQADATASNQKAKELTHTIAIAESRKPSDYSPHLEGWVSGLGGLSVALVVAGGLLRMTHRHDRAVIARRLESKNPTLASDTQQVDGADLATN